MFGDCARSLKVGIMPVCRKKFSSLNYCKIILKKISGVQFVLLPLSFDITKSYHLRGLETNKVYR